ncbi:MAG TPA: DEAD/DEAH box helicase [Nitriliruptorales bacterium]
MARRTTLRMRPWQKSALELFEASGHQDFLTVATPGAGKTTFALTAAVRHLADHPRRRVVVVAPTQHLKLQWVRAAALFGLHLEPQWSVRDGRLPADMHGIVVTYAQVSTSAVELRALATDAFVVFDEIHHAGHERAWGDSTYLAFSVAAQRLSISGTPFRSDTNPIPFVRYDGDASLADYEYGYADALRDGGVVRPVFFPRTNGHMEWTAPDGAQMAATFDDHLDVAGNSQRLRTALDLSGEWIRAVLHRAHETLTGLRATHPQAGGLVIAMDQEHARGIVRLMRDQLGVRARVATSDDPQASDKIAAFARSTDEWMVAVRMVSEGVDIPRLRVGVYATNTTTELFFRQAVGRLVRWTAGMSRQRAFMFIPDDPRLRQFAFGIAEQRRHSLRKREVDRDLDLDEEQELLARANQEERVQMDLFQAISAVALEREHSRDVFAADHPEDVAYHGAHEHDESLRIELLPPPAVAGGHDAVSDPAFAAPEDELLSRRDYKRRLRDDNADAARELTRLTGRTHREINAELNALAGIERISEATVRQLEQRLRHAGKLIRSA